jgi:TPR repeat protein
MNGMEKNAGTAAVWFAKAGEAGDTSALYSLAELYRDGKGVSQDKAKALDLFTRAARGGSIVAMTKVGEAYALGTLGPRDRAAAWMWYNKAADEHDETAMLAVAQAYETGSLVEKDLDAARNWYLKLAITETPYDEVLQAKWRLSKGFYSGSLGRQSFKEAAILLLEAAKAGYEPAVNVLKPETLKALDREMRKAVQQELARLDAYDGAIDGSIGSGTLKAIDAYLADEDDEDAE